MKSELKKQLILNEISDLVSDLYYYDRKEDLNMPLGFIENAIASKDILISDMVDHFFKEVYKRVG